MTLESTLSRAEEAYRQGNLVSAYSLYVELLSQNYQREAVLNRLAQISLQANDGPRSLHYLQELCESYPSTLSYCEARANLYVQAKQWRDAANCYIQFLEANPAHANAHFNAGYYLKLAGEYLAAIECYQLALENRVSQPQEVLTNMAVIYSEHLRQEDKAKECLERALVLEPTDTVAMFNLATLYEEEGKKDKAATYFQRIVELEPSHHLALARLAEAQKVSDPDAPIIENLQRVLRETGINDAIRSKLNYALGKVFDDCREYDQAFKHYETANGLDKHKHPSYSKQQQQQLVDDNIRFFTENWFADNNAVSDAAPIFICGMFRSGSTLTEQVLASHSNLCAGGERDFFLKLASKRIQPYPSSLASLELSDMQGIANEYLVELATAFPGDARPTDKRPDNFLYLGLIKTLFPNAKFIHTNRNPLDNCLSVYFLQTASSMNYASNLNNIAHYYKQQRRLMEHWKSVFPESIHTVDYDELVANPEPVVRGMLQFLALPWEAQCLDFHRLQNRVKTASIWQVRQALYKSSSGRWKNYQNHISELMLEFED